MITRETVIYAGDFKVRFTVYNDINWLVSISNDKLEVGASGDYCYSNWNKGLASAFVNYAEMVNDDEAQNLMYELVMSENIDNGFTKYLPQPYSSSCYGCPFRKDCESTPSLCIGG